MNPANTPPYILNLDAAPKAVGCRVVVVGSMAWAAAIAVRINHGMSMDGQQLNVEFVVADALSEVSSIQSGDFVVLHIPCKSDVLPAVRWVPAIRTDTPNRVVVAVGPAAVDWQWQLREVGVAAVFSRTWQANSLVGMIRRFRSRQPVEPPRDIVETLG